MRFKSCLVDGCDRNAHHDGAGKRGMCSLHYVRWKKHGDPLYVWKQETPALDWIKAHMTFESDECLKWPFSIGADGYGRAHEPKTGKLMTASRLMCVFAHGQPPTPKHEAAHSCGNGNEACTNPRHLYWATPTRNHADKVVHGTTNRGERQGQSKLTESDIWEIRRLLGTMSQTAIAKRFGVIPRHISDIKYGKRWGWLT